ncbi:hypothetical protein J7643_05000 [bacterium]|nr:hypothetical protein [bacterium]
MRISRICSLLMVASALAFAVNGCGGGATLIDPEAVNSSKQLRTTDPTAPVVVAATPAPTPAPVSDAFLTATVTNIKKPTLGLGKLAATVEVTNPSNIALTGTVKVVFINNQQPSGEPQSRTVTVQPKGKETITFTGTSWFLDSAQAEVTTQRTSGGYAGTY